MHSMLWQRADISAWTSMAPWYSPTSWLSLDWPQPFSSPTCDGTNLWHPNSRPSNSVAMEDETWGAGGSFGASGHSRPARMDNAGTTAGSSKSSWRYVPQARGPDPHVSGQPEGEVRRGRLLMKLLRDNLPPSREEMISFGSYKGC